MAVAADLWNVLQGLEASMQKPIKSRINIYSHMPVTVQTHSQSQAADDSQLNVQQDSQTGLMKYANLMNAGQKSFTAAITMYENDLKTYNLEQLVIQKLVKFINQMVSPLYLESCCEPEDKINTWYTNLQKTAGTSTTQEYNHA